MPRGRPKAKLTKKQALTQFKEQELVFVKETYEKDGKLDRVARCEAWSNYVDALEKDGLITESQANRWTNPF